MMENVVGIYKITNPKGCIYIGQSVDVKRRFASYKNKGFRGQPRLYNSFAKYGVDNHLFEVIHECNINELNELEIYYITLYNTFNSKFGLNLDSGGNEQKKRTEETKQKISNTKKQNEHPFRGKKLSEEHRQKLANACKGRKHSDETKAKLSEMRTGEKNPFYGKKHSKESIEKIINKLTGRKHSEEAIKKMSGRTHTEETKQLLRDINKGRKFSDEAKKKMSLGRMGDKNHMFGKTLTDEHKKKISDARKKYWAERKLSKEY